MILLVNAGLFLLFGLLAFLYAQVLEPSPDCATEACARSRDGAQGARLAAPALLGLGTLLILLGLFLGRRQEPQP